MNFKQAVSFLNTRPNYENRQNYSYSKDLELDRVRDVLVCLESPQNSYPSILVAGTNGKGSVVTMTAAALQAHGYKTGVFTSPHLVDLRERICINDELISKVAFSRALEKIRKRVPAQLINSLTYFELLTVLMFYYFAKKAVDIAVIEVGMGGRLDATNVVQPVVSVITKIGFDHEDKLGSTLTKITKEKAGIISQGGIVVSGKQEVEAKQVIKSVAKINGARAFFVSQKKEQPKYALIGKHQRQNGAIAMKTLECLEPYLARVLNWPKVRKAIADSRMPGRLERVSKRPLVYLDGAHNASALVVSIRSLKTEHPRKQIIAVMGISQDKDVVKMIKVIDRERIRVILTESSSDRALKSTDFISRMSGSSAIIAASRNIKKALTLACRYAGTEGIVLICGSFYLIADYKRL